MRRLWESGARTSKPDIPSQQPRPVSDAAWDEWEAPPAAVSAPCRPQSKVAHSVASESIWPALLECMTSIRTLTQACTDPAAVVKAVDSIIGVLLRLIDSPCLL